MKLEELKQKIEDTNREIRDNAKTALEGSFKEIFEEYPELHGFRWTQYTPSFNDGDPCEFTVGDIDVLVEPIKLGIKFKKNERGWLKANIGYTSTNEEGEYDEDGNEVDSSEQDAKLVAGEDIKVWMHLYVYKDKSYDVPARTVEFVKKIQLFNSSDLEDVYAYAYGGDKRIEVTRDGTNVEDYDCGY